MERVPGPWVIKPRSDVSAIGIRKVSEPEEVWRAIDEMNERENLRERASYYVLARFIPGEVFHVDSVVNDGKVVFAGRISTDDRRCRWRTRAALTSRARSSVDRSDEKDVAGYE